MQRGLSGRVGLLTTALIRLLLLLSKLLKHGLLKHRLLKHRLLKHRLLNGVDLERKQASQLSDCATYRAAHARLSEQATDRITHGLANLSDQIAEDPLRRQLLHLLLVQLLCIGLLELLHRVHLER